MTFWGGSGSGSADPCFWLMDPDPDPGSGSRYFRHWPSRCQQKTNFLTQFFLLITFWSYSYIIFQKLKVKESQNSRNQGFSYYFCMMIEESGSGSRAGSGSGSIPLTSGSGSMPLTSGSGSRRPKNMWIRIRIRIRNTALTYCQSRRWLEYTDRVYNLVHIHLDKHWKSFYSPNDF